jgi:multicomponent Na+:H+ antiporter subunit F
MSTVVDVALASLAVAALLCVVRLVRPGSIPDRIVALDTLVIVIVAGIATEFTRDGESSFLSAMLVAALLGFTGTVVIARFVERRGA